jgi:hypothetical protein
MKPFLWLSSWCLVFTSAFVLAESKAPGEYPGVSDPFADPSHYEFADEEKDDKEFFHLGRFLMFGADVGAGIFTGGLGTTASPAVLFGGRLVYFFDKALALEGRVSYSLHQDLITAGAGVADLDVTLFSFGGGFRYYFDTKSAPRAIAIANPFLAIGGGLYMRTPAVVSNTISGASFQSSSSFGVYGGGGVEFLIYKNHIYLGLDLRYHMVFFPDESSTLGGAVLAGSRGGDFITTAATITYSF